MGGNMKDSECRINLPSVQLSSLSRYFS